MQKKFKTVVLEREEKKWLQESIYYSMKNTFKDESDQIILYKLR